MDVNSIKNIEAEAGVIASIIQKPEMVFFSENLTPNMFSDENNAFLYWAIRELARKGATKIDSLNITNALNSRAATRERTSVLTIPALNELIDLSKLIARDTAEDYLVLVNGVMDAAFRRETYNRLVSCERLCFNSSEHDIQQKIYETLDNVMLEYSTTCDIPQFKDMVDPLWGEIVAHQDGGVPGYKFKFPTLNQYVTIERGELVVFAAEQKAGKSIMLLNIAVDLLKQGLSVLYLDSELGSRLFLCRMISHLTGIEFRRVKSGAYSQEEAERIALAIEWLKQQKFTHKYIPMFDTNTIYTTAKRVKHTQGIDVLIVDYFKGAGETDAFAQYASLGKLVDLVKNQICGQVHLGHLAQQWASKTL